MTEKRASYYINGRDVNADHDDLPPRLRPPNCELPRRWTKPVSPESGNRQAAAVGLALALVVAAAWAARRLR